MFKKSRLLYKVTAFISVVCLSFAFFAVCRVANSTRECFAMPFYHLNPQEIVLRAQFYTSYPTSTEERKANILLATKSIDKTLIDVGGEFSFNRTVGERTEIRGYKRAKIIVGGEFVDGVGGGVCQVSTTLYNAVLLSGLTVTEYHPHSLPVSYIAPSFDAMVNSGSADLRFVNNTDNPVFLRAYADGSVLRIEIYGQPMQEKYSRQSLITEKIPAPQSEILYDELGEYPDLYEGDSKIVKYGKDGYKSEGYLIVTKNGKLAGMKKIRSDSYSAVRGKVVFGKAIKPLQELCDKTMQSQNK